jgi:hypothetical protein
MNTAVISGKTFSENVRNLVWGNRVQKHRNARPVTFAATLVEAELGNAAKVVYGNLANRSRTAWLAKLVVVFSTRSVCQDASGRNVVQKAIVLQANVVMATNAQRRQFAIASPRKEWETVGLCMSRRF